MHFFAEQRGDRRHVISSRFLPEQLPDRRIYFWRERSLAKRKRRRTGQSLGFVLEFRPLGAGEIRQLLEQSWVPPGMTSQAALGV